MTKSHIVKRLCTPFARTDSDRLLPASEEPRIRFAFTVFVLSCILLLVVFGIKNLVFQATIESALNFGSALFLGGIIYSQKFVRRAIYLCRWSLLVLAVMFFYISAVGGHSGYKILWINLFPLGSFFLLGNREGIAWSMAFFLGMLFLLSDANNFFPVYPYPEDFRLRVHMVYLSLAGFMFIYESTRRFYQDRLEQNQRQLITEKEKLIEAGQQLAASASQVRESEAKYKLLVDNSHDGIFIAQEDRIRYANPRARSFLGLPRHSSSLDIPLADFIHPGDREMVLSRHRKRLSGLNPPDGYSFRIVNENSGQLLWIQLNSVSIQWEGRPAVICFCHDITQTKSLEIQLLQAQKMQAIGTLAGGIAHDFNNMLSAIIGYAEMASNSPSADDAQRHRLHRILEASERARSLIAQILTFSRQQNHDCRPVSIAPIIREALTLLTGNKPPSVDIVEQIDDDAAVVMADPTQIHQILMNLGTNAFHAMKENGGQLTVSLKTVDLNDEIKAEGLGLSAGFFVRIRVRDNGYGIAPQTISRIFDPYFTTKKPGEGTGLGLAVVHGTVKSLNGAVFVSSQQGEGTTFDVLIPKVEAEVEPVHARPLSCPMGDETILLVDDEKIVIDIVTEILESLGYHVVARVSSIEAYSAFRESPDKFHAVVADYTMPDMDGMELARKISAIRGNLPILLCTGFSIEPSSSKLKAAGVDAVLNKPLLKNELAVSLRNLLDRPGPIPSNRTV